DFDNGEIKLDFTYDTINSIPFPTEGSFMSLNYLASREGLGADQEFDQAGFQVLSTFSSGKGSLLLGASYNTTFDDDAPIQNLFRSGGFLKLSGLQLNQLSGQHSGRLTAAYLYELKKLRFFKFYAGASLELGNTWNDTSDVDFNNSLVAGSVFLGADTPIGPVYVAVGAAEGGEQSLYLFVGPPWF
ncbi:MAG TPA: patatin, partial [Gammaproteobacteria bacterium]|nr:patatin [Gammaproteobacteria bacterium]